MRLCLAPRQRPRPPLGAQDRARSRLARAGMSWPDSLVAAAEAHMKQRVFTCYFLLFTPVLGSMRRLREDEEKVQFYV